MPIGAIGQGLAESFAGYIKGERERTRKLEDEDIEYQQKLISSLADRPDINPAMLGKALHDLVNLSAAKSGKRSLKSGAEGFMGHSELPMSQFLQGISDGITPIQGPTTEQYAMPQLPTEAAGVPGPQMISPGIKDMFSGKMVPGMEPAPEGARMPPDASKLASASQDMAQWKKSKGRRPVANQPLLRMPEEMAQEKGRAQGAGTVAEIEGITEGLGGTAGISEKDKDQLVRKKLGLPIYRQANATKVVLPDGKEVAAAFDPNVNMYVSTDGTDTPLPGAKPVSNSTNRLSSLYQLGASILGIPQDSATWTPEQGQALRSWMLSTQGADAAQRLGLRNEYDISKAYGMPLQPTEAVAGGVLLGSTLADAAGRPALPNDVRQRVQATQAMMALFDRVDQLTERLLAGSVDANGNPVPGGVWERVGNYLYLNQSRLNGNPDYAALQAEIRTNLANIARASGDVGNIAVTEGERYLEGMTQLGGVLSLPDTLAQAKARTSAMRANTAQRAASMVGAQYDGSNPSEFVNRVYQTITPPINLVPPPPPIGTPGAGFRGSSIPQPPASRAGGNFSVAVGDKVYTFPNKQQLDNFKAAAGIP